MTTIALLAQKGGAGKTTLAIHLAGVSISRGWKTAIVDTDPQRSVSHWGDTRSHEAPEIIARTSSSLRSWIDEAPEDGYDLVLIDTAPHAKKAAAHAANVADIAVIPTRPSILDVRAIAATVEIVSSMDTKAIIVLNSGPPPRHGGKETALVQEARHGLADYGLAVCPIAIAQRADLSHALIDGRTITEYAPKGKASQEMKRLLTWLSKA